VGYGLELDVFGAMRRHLDFQMVGFDQHCDSLSYRSPGPAMSPG
jgi:hypothetical protein